MLRATTTTKLFPAATTATKPSKLDDRELAMLESTLRVQLQVSKCVRMAQVTGAVGVTALSGPLAAVPSGVSIVSSQFQRQKLKRRHRKVVREMGTRGVVVIVGADEASQLGTRAYAISMATGLACCLLAFSADLLIDRAVVKVVSEAAMNYVDELVVGSLTTHMAEQLTPATTAIQQEQPREEPQPNKAKALWGGLMAKWKTARAKRQHDSLPPDLFGERDGLNVSSPPPLENVEVERSNEFTPFGECLVLRFAETTPGAHGHAPGVHEPNEREHVHQSSHTLKSTESDALSEAQWQSLWTPENDEHEDCDLFGTNSESYDLFGDGGKRGADTTDAYDLFGSRGDEDTRESEACDLFGVENAPHNPRR